MGSSLAIFIPADEVRKARLVPDQDVVLDIEELEAEPALGFLRRRGLTKADFEGMDELLYPDGS